jgi:hypothetical protein
MSSARIGIVVLCLSASLVAQSVHSQTASVRVPSAAKPATDSATAAPDHPSLDATIFDLQRITVATDSDIADLDINQWKPGWKTAWKKIKRGNATHRQEAKQVADSLRHNLSDAMPGLINDVQTSRGSVSSAFKLYNDLSVVVESLDSLVSITREYGKKGEAGPLSNDYTALNRLRQDISSYIQSTAANLEPKTKAPTPAPGTPSHTQPRKIVVDDNVPDTKPAKKKTAALNQ